MLKISIAIFISIHVLYNNSLNASFHLSGLNNLSLQLKLLNKAIVQENYAQEERRFNELKNSLSKIDKRFKELSDQRFRLNSSRKEIVEQLIKLKEKVIPAQVQVESLRKINKDQDLGIHQGLKNND